MKRFKCLVSEEEYFNLRRDDIHAGRPLAFTGGRFYAMQCSRDGSGPVDAEREVYLRRRSGLYDYDLEIFKEGLEHEQSILKAAYALTASMRGGFHA